MIATVMTVALLLLGVLLTEAVPLLRSLPVAVLLAAPRVLRPHECLVAPVWTAP